VTLFAVNRDQREPLALDVDLRSLPRLASAGHVALFDADPEATNTAANPDRVIPTRQPDAKVTDGRLSVQLPPLSWNMLRVTP
jgi:alpha-N-arabinofuranosidase